MTHLKMTFLHFTRLITSFFTNDTEFQKALEKTQKKDLELFREINEVKTNFENAEKHLELAAKSFKEARKGLMTYRKLMNEKSPKVKNEIREIDVVMTPTYFPLHTLKIEIIDRDFLRRDAIQSSQMTKHEIEKLLKGEKI